MTNTMRKEGIRTPLKAIETGDPASVGSHQP
jgi:hypothetical protein